MTTSESNLFHAAIFGAVALVSAPVLGELVVRPAFTLGWNTAAFCAALVSNGFAF